MVTAFLSYARTDAAAIDQLARDVRALGLQVWFDTELSGGAEWWGNILSVIEGCDVFVYCLSNDSVDSAACQAEFAYARALNRFVLPIQITSALNAATLPRDLAVLHCIDYQLADKSALLFLARALLERGPSKSLPADMPPKPPPPLSYLGELREQIDERALDFDRQSSLLLRIKELVRAGRLSECRELVVRFRKRHDIYAIVAEEIDAALGAPLKTLPPTPHAPPADPPVKWVKRLALQALDHATGAQSKTASAEGLVPLADLAASTYAELRGKYSDERLMASLSIDLEGHRYLYHNYSFADLGVAVDYALKRIAPRT